MSSDPNLMDDPFGYRDDVLDALVNPGFDSPAGSDTHSAAAFSLCLALGRCRLFDVSLDDSIDGSLPQDVARAAAERFLQHLQGWNADAVALADHWDAAVDAVEAEDLCGGILSARMDAWAIWIALDESYRDWLESADNDDEAFVHTLEEIAVPIRQFDLALQGHIDLLSTIADLHLLDNWREEIASELQSCLPWWLDGSLEDVHEQHSRTLEQGLPDEDTWRQLSESLSVTSLPQRTWRFQLSDELQLAAAGPAESKIVLETEGRELWIIRHGQPDLLCLQLMADPEVRVDEILIDGKPLELVEDWDDEQEAVFRRQDVMPALQAGCKIELRVREAGGGKSV